MDETLQDKITRLSNELDALEQKGITTEEDINLRNQLINEKSQAEYDLAHQQEHEERMDKAQIAINNEIDEFVYEGETFTIRDFAENDVGAQILRISFANKFMAQAEAYSRNVRELMESFDKEREETNQLVQTLKEQLAKSILEKEDAGQKRDAAVRRAEQAETELQNASVPSELKQTNLSSNLAEEMKLWKESRPAIYDVQPTDVMRKVDFTAKFVDTDEELTDKYVYIKKYRILEGEELARFQAELASQKESEPAIPYYESDLAEECGEGINAPANFPQTQVSNAHTADGLAETASTVARETVSRQEFEALKADVETLKADVETLKLRNGMVA